MRSTGQTIGDPLEAAHRSLPPRWRVALTAAILAIAVGPAVLHITDAGPEKLRWRMYADAAHLNIRYETIDGAGGVHTIDLDRLDRWTAAQHRGPDLPRTLCRQVAGAAAVRRIVGDRIEEVWEC
ncbi:hypothetical protein [Actinomarinicola tropica]|uniref:Uncharacterized protein n=1 Tax=Actinomarinicola tropica TaxID=2789776 RepID=A0A5Q2RF60_9ACTN|nr:hypothetical protein [Actinomarinicola tropica]QGG95459.1 hypothetical protein GH723_10315 [Actinomarinicola tropica]